MDKCNHLRTKRANFLPVYNLVTAVPDRKVERSNSLKLPIAVSTRDQFFDIRRRTRAFFDSLLRITWYSGPSAAHRLFPEYGKTPNYFGLRVYV